MNNRNFESNIDKRSFLSTALIAGLAVTAIPFAAHAQPKYYTRRGNAIEGYDVTSYFSRGGPWLGSPKFRAVWSGASWYFSSSDRLSAFREAPEKYAPQYGGYSAYAVARNYIYRTDPTAFTIIDGKLYLNANHDIHNRWIRNRDVEIRKANRFWPNLSRKLT